MTTMAAVVMALALAAPEGGRAGALAGCSAVPLTDLGWRYECPSGRGARVEDHAAGPSDAYVDGFEGGLAGAFPSGVTRSTAARKLGGGEVPVRAGAARGGAGGYLVAVLRRKEGRRLVACTTADAQRDPCDATLATLAAGPWRGPPAAGAARGQALALELAGRAVALPRGCTGVAASPGEAAVRCEGPTVAGWAPVPTEAAGPQLLQQLEARFKALDRPGLDYRRDDLPCLLDGARATCARVVVMDQGRRWVALWTVATVRGLPHAAYCLAPAGKPPASRELQPPCTIPFDLPPGVGAVPPLPPPKPGARSAPQAAH